MKINFSGVFRIAGTFVKRMLYCFSLCIIIVSIGGQYFATDETMHFLSTRQSLTFLTFSILFAASLMIADFIKDNIIIKCAVQFALSYSSLLLIIMNGGSFKSYVETSSFDNPGFSYTIYLSLIYVICYLTCTLLYALGSFIVRRVTNSEKEYKDMYSSNSKE